MREIVEHLQAKVREKKYQLTSHAFTIYRPDPEDWVNWRVRKEPG